jgi:hypothetical protein
VGPGTDENHRSQTVKFRASVAITGTMEGSRHSMIGAARSAPIGRLSSPSCLA